MGIHTLKETERLLLERIRSELASLQKEGNLSDHDKGVLYFTGCVRRVEDRMKWWSVSEQQLREDIRWLEDMLLNLRGMRVEVRQHNFQNDSTATLQHTQGDTPSIDPPCISPGQNYPLHQ